MRGGERQTSGLARPPPPLSPPKRGAGNRASRTGISWDFLEFLDYDAFSMDSGVLGGPGRSQKSWGSQGEVLGGPELLYIKSTRKEQTLSFAWVLTVESALL